MQIEIVDMQIHRIHPHGIFRVKTKTAHSGIFTGVHIHIRAVFKVQCSSRTRNKIRGIHVQSVKIGFRTCPRGGIMDRIKIHHRSICKTQGHAAVGVAVDNDHTALYGGKVFHTQRVQRIAVFIGSGEDKVVGRREHHFIVVVVLQTVMDRRSLTGFCHVVDKGIVGKFRVGCLCAYRSAVIRYVAAECIVGEINIRSHVVNENCTAVSRSCRSCCGGIVVFKNIVVKCDICVSVIGRNHYRAATLCMGGMAGFVQTRTFVVAENIIGNIDRAFRTAECHRSAAPTPLITGSIVFKERVGNGEITIEIIHPDPTVIRVVLFREARKIDVIDLHRTCHAGDPYRRTPGVLSGDGTAEELDPVLCQFVSAVCRNIHGTVNDNGLFHAGRTHIDRFTVEIAEFAVPGNGEIPANHIEFTVVRGPVEVEFGIMHIQIRAGSGTVNDPVHIVRAVDIGPIRLQVPVVVDITVRNVQCAEALSHDTSAFRMTVAVVESVNIHIVQIQCGIVHEETVGSVDMSAIHFKIIECDFMPVDQEHIERTIAGEGDIVFRFRDDLFPVFIVGNGNHCPVNDQMTAAGDIHAAGQRNGGIGNIIFPVAIRIQYLVGNVDINGLIGIVHIHVVCHFNGFTQRGHIVRIRGAPVARPGKRIHHDGAAGFLHFQCGCRMGKGNIVVAVVKPVCRFTDGDGVPGIDGFKRFSVRKNIPVSIGKRVMESHIVAFQYFSGSIGIMIEGLIVDRADCDLNIVGIDCQHPFVDDQFRTFFHRNTEGVKEKSLFRIRKHFSVDRDILHCHIGDGIRSCIVTAGTGNITAGKGSGNQIGDSEAAEMFHKGHFSGNIFCSQIAVGIDQIADGKIEIQFFRLNSRSQRTRDKRVFLIRTGVAPLVSGKKRNVRNRRFRAVHHTVPGGAAVTAHIIIVCSHSADQSSGGECGRRGKDRIAACIHQNGTVIVICRSHGGNRDRAGTVDPVAFRIRFEGQTVGSENTQNRGIALVVGGNELTVPGDHCAVNRIDDPVLRLVGIGNGGTHHNGVCQIKILKIVRIADDPVVACIDNGGVGEIDITLVCHVCQRTAVFIFHRVVQEGGVVEMNPGIIVGDLNGSAASAVIGKGGDPSRRVIHHSQGISVELDSAGNIEGRTAQCRIVVGKGAVCDFYRVSITCIGIERRGVPAFVPVVFKHGIRNTEVPIPQFQCHRHGTAVFDGIPGCRIVPCRIIGDQIRRVAVFCFREIAGVNVMINIQPVCRN